MKSKCFFAFKVLIFIKLVKYGKNVVDFFKIMAKVAF